MKTVYSRTTSGDGVVVVSTTLLVQSTAVIRRGKSREKAEQRLSVNRPSEEFLMRKVNIKCVKFANHCRELKRYHIRTGCAQQVYAWIL